MAADKSLQQSDVDESIRQTLRLIAKGERPGPMLRRLLVDALVNDDRSDRPADPDALASAAARSATEWMGVGADRREKVLRELLLLADALRPSPPQALSLPDKISVVHQRLKDGGISHAIGGALAVGYYGEPRSTIDIDINVFMPADRWPDLRKALTGLGVALEVEEKDLRRANEVRLEWDSSFLHLFFSCDSLHERMRQSIRCVPFNDGTLPLIAPQHLIVRKAMLDRTKDWLDIEQILVATSPLDLEEIENWLGRMIDEEDPRIEKLAEVKAALSLD